MPNTWETLSDPEGIFTGDPHQSSLTGKKNKAPPEMPDLLALADKEGQNALRLALLQNALNRPSEVNPFGSRTWTLREGADPNNPQPGDWQLTTALNDRAQGVFDQQQDFQSGLLGAGSDALTKYSSRAGTGFDLSSLPDMPDLSWATGPEAFSNDRRRIEQSLYDANTRYLGERFNKDEASLRDQLLQQGLTPGSEAYQQALTGFTQGKNRAYQGAMDSAIAGGGAEQSRLLADALRTAGMQMSERQQGFQELLAERQIPMQELRSIISSAIGDPSGAALQSLGSGFMGASMPGAVGLVGPAGQMYGSQVGIYNAQQESQAMGLQALAKLFASFFGA